MRRITGVRDELLEELDDMDELLRDELLEDRDELLEDIDELLRELELELDDGISFI